MTETIKMLSSENVALRTENESLISARPVNGKMLIKKNTGLKKQFTYLVMFGVD